MRIFFLKPKLLIYFSFCVFLTININTVNATEREELAQIIKQLTQVKESFLRSEIVSGTEQKERYHFNYQAAQDDINQIISGIEGYLSPTRSQPRNLNFPEIQGEYSLEINHE